MSVSEGRAADFKPWARFPVGRLSSPDGHHVTVSEEYHRPFAVRRYWRKPGSINSRFGQYRFFWNLFAANKEV